MYDVKMATSKYRQNGHNLIQKVSLSPVAALLTCDLKHLLPLAVFPVLFALYILLFFLVDYLPFD